MATKTISLELDAYEKLRRAKRGGESFSAVVRRARIEDGPGVMEEPRAGYPNAADSPVAAVEYWDRIDDGKRVKVALESFDAASRRQMERNRKWNNSGDDTASAAGRGWIRDDLYTERGQ